MKYVKPQNMVNCEKNGQMKIHENQPEDKN